MRFDIWYDLQNRYHSVDLGKSLSNDALVIAIGVDTREDGSPEKYQHEIHRFTNTIPLCTGMSHT